MMSPVAVVNAASPVSVVVSASDSETSSVPTEAGARISRSTGLLIAVGILASIALVAALYLARAFFVPLLIGILASYALSPLVDWLKAHRVPRPLAAAAVMAVLVGGLSWV